MNASDIVKYGNSVLKTPTELVDEVNDELKKLIQEMYDIMVEAKGVGLAANQIGIPKRFFVYDAGEGHHALINPKVIRKSGEQVGVEGCLSIPNLQGDVARADFIEVEGLDENGEPVRIQAEGWQARIFQHEIDHLDGYLFIDRADPDTLELVEPGSDEGEE